MERSSDGKGEFGEACLEPAAGLGIEAEFVVSAAKVLDERMPTTDNLGGADAFDLTLVKLLILASEGRCDLRFPWWSRLDLRANLIS